MSNKLTSLFATALAALSMLAVPMMTYADTVVTGAGPTSGGARSPAARMSRPATPDAAALRAKIRITGDADQYADGVGSGSGQNGRTWSGADTGGEIYSRSLLTGETNGCPGGNCNGLRAELELGGSDWAASHAGAEFESNNGQPSVAQAGTRQMTDRKQTANIMIGVPKRHIPRRP